MPVETRVGARSLNIPSVPEGSSAARARPSLPANAVANTIDMQPPDMQDVPTLLATLGLGIAALCTFCSLLSHLCRCSRGRRAAAPLHLQEDLLEVAPPPGLGVTLLPSLGCSISHGLVAFLCYATALATLAALGLGAEASAAVALERSAAFLLLGGCTESELWQGIRDRDGGFWRPQLWRLRAALRCAAAALLSAGWLWPLLQQQRVC